VILMWSTIKFFFNRIGIFELLLLTWLLVVSISFIQYYFWGYSTIALWSQSIDEKWKWGVLCILAAAGWHVINDKIERLQTCSDVNFEAGGLNYQRLEARIERLDIELNERLHNIEDAIAEIKNTISQGQR
jgi:hypothetical protein